MCTVRFSSNTCRIEFVRTFLHLTQETIHAFTYSCKSSPLVLLDFRSVMRWGLEDALEESDLIPDLPEKSMSLLERMRIVFPKSLNLVCILSRNFSHSSCIDSMTDLKSATCASNISILCNKAPRWLLPLLTPHHVIHLLRLNQSKCSCFGIWNRSFVWKGSQDTGIDTRTRSSNREKTLFESSMMIPANETFPGCYPSQLFWNLPAPLCRNSHQAISHLGGISFNNVQFLGGFTKLPFLVWKSFQKVVVECIAYTTWSQALESLADHRRWI